MNKKLFVLLIQALLLATIFAQSEQYDYLEKQSDQALKDLQSIQDTVSNLHIAAFNAKSLQEAIEVYNIILYVKEKAQDAVDIAKVADKELNKNIASNQVNRSYLTQTMNDLQEALNNADSDDKKEQLNEDIKSTQNYIEDINQLILNEIKTSQKLRDASQEAQNIYGDIEKAIDEIEQILQQKQKKYTDEEAKKVEEANNAKEEEAKNAKEEEAKNAKEKEAKDAKEEEAKNAKEEEAKNAKEEEAKNDKEEEAKKAKEANNAQEEAKKAESKVSTNPSSGKVMQFALAFTAVLLTF